MLLTSPLLLYIIIIVFVLSGFIIFFVNLISKHKEQIRKYTDLIDDNDIACEKLKHQLSAIEKKNILLNHDIDKIQRQHQKHLDRLKPEYRKIYTQLMSTIDKLDIMTSKFHESEDAFNSLLDDNRELEHELHELSAENLHLRDEIALLKSKNPGLEPKRHHGSVNQTDISQFSGTNLPQPDDNPNIGIDSELTAKGLYIESAPQEDLKVPQPSSTIHDSLSNVLSTITSNANVKASTIADNLGLIVAEKGQRKYTEGLAGIAASFDSLNKQIHSFIPIGELKQITVTDKNDVTVSAFPFTVSDEKLVVMLLSAGTAPTTSAVEEALTGATDDHNQTTMIKAQNSNHFVIAQ
jgi:predicted regulator of Ras-like GTPase activity (Roadblock/LC7/MglB family)